MRIEVSIRWCLVAVACLLALLVARSLLLEVPYAGEASRRASCRDNLRAIALAMKAYQEENGSYPPSVVHIGKSHLLQSWRVLLLPYCGEKPLYANYHLDEAWNSPHNVAFTKHAPSIYVCPGREDYPPYETSYVMLGRSESGEKRAENERQVLVIELRDSGIGWAEPQDVSLEDLQLGINSPNGVSISSLHPGGAFVLWTDGTVEFLSDPFPPSFVHSILER